EDPVLLGVLTVIGSAALRRIAFGRNGRAALLDQRADVDRVVVANDNVVAARAQRVTAADRDVILAGTANDLESTDYTPAMKIAVVQFVLLDDVTLQPIQVLLGQELAGEEAGPAKAFQSGAYGTDRKLAAFGPRRSASGR